MELVGKTVKGLDESSSILIHIAFHFYEEDYCLSCKSFSHAKNRIDNSEIRFSILFRVLQTFLLYPCKKMIVVDTNHEEVRKRLQDFGFFENIQVLVYKSLTHPWILTWQHRESFQENIDKYDFFFYTEDDMIIPFSHLQKYFDRMNSLWPHQVASFVRFEPLNDKVKLCVDAISKSKRLYSQIIQEKFLNLNNDYCACWGMERDMLKESFALKEFLFSSSISPCNIRIFASSWPTLQLQKVGYIELDSSFLIKPYCMIQHATRNYIRFPNKPFCTLNVEEVFEFTE
jgi:hypothetical protein